MPKNLVIVESPTKARTVSRYLGRDYQVEASVGHIRDLPANRLGVDIENGYTPRYVIPAKKKEIVKRLKLQAKEATDVYLATDPDREGEAISWHLSEALNLKDPGRIHRVEFHEITRDAIARAFASPRAIDRGLVDAQQVRRILDRLVGYSLSPLLRRKISKRGLSAGRVQSVAVRLVVDREREIEAFESKEYWTIDVELIKEKATGRARPRPFTATLVQIDGQKPELSSKGDAERVVDELKRSAFSVADVREREVQRSPSAPFTTSTLQQEASRKLGFSAKRTMAVAQQLYEGVNLAGEGSVGLITYMRTDSTNIAPSAQTESLSYIRSTYGDDFVPATPRVYKAKSKGAQEAHEAIRPTDPRRTAESMKGEITLDQSKLYKLIWQRMISSQMSNSVYDSVTVDVATDPADRLAAYLLRATGSTVKFKGFTIVYTEGRDDGDRDEEAQRPLPPVAIGDRLRSNSVVPSQHFTQPPPRFTDATLVKTLEENGVGRPSTYAPTLSTIQDRGYVERFGRQMLPTELGRVVTDLLVEHFPDIVDVQFTAGMEEKLDDVANDGVTWVSVLEAFYPPFADRLRQADHDIVQILMQPELAGEDCPNCGQPMLIKHGRFGKFIACSNFPTCKTAKSFLVKVGQPCPLCLTGELVEKRTRRGRLFYGCSRHPDCGFMAWQRPITTPCPQCGGILTESGRDNAKCLSCNAVVKRPEPEVEQLVAAVARAR